VHDRFGKSPDLSLHVGGVSSCVEKKKDTLPEGDPLLLKDSAPKAHKDDCEEGRSAERLCHAVETKRDTPFDI
jgi:hypothetical protein